MRKRFAHEIMSLYSGPEYFFLTGDLGFMALECVRDVMQDRFINCGVAEQNMVSVAAGLSRGGFNVFVYSIAPFCYARPFEQIRNDICFGNLNVCLVGNGGGYAYGHMGPSHHALEDCSVMASLGVHVYSPAFNDDIPSILSCLSGPSYLRLGYDEHPKDYEIPKYAPWRKILNGENGIIIVFGSLSGLVWRTLMVLDEKFRPSLWAVTELPFGEIPKEIILRLQKGVKLAIFEEHKFQGGIGMNIIYSLTTMNIHVSQFEHRYALGYPSHRFGSQAFHRKECGLDQIEVLNILDKWDGIRS